MRGRVMKGGRDKTEGWTLRAVAGMHGGGVPPAYLDKYDLLLRGAH